ncbi:MAG: gliding motility protein GldC [Brumimicrobium sp.]
MADKKSDIIINVLTNENNVPISMKWSAEDGGIKDSETQAVFLSLWDSKEESAMKIDLWTPEMTVDEMKVFFHQTLLTMADSFERATGEVNIVEDLRDYCYHFAEKMEIMPEDD